MTSNYMLRVEGVSKVFDISAPWLNRVIERRPKQSLKAVDNISFNIPRGTTYSLVGESGCGKSTVARLAVGLYKPSAGTLRYGPSRHGGELRHQMIFQDPYASLNPRWRVGEIIAEPIRTMRLRESEKEIRHRIDELLELVGLAISDGRNFPHEFSGGQRQRISIARALASEAEFLVCDEPTSALDVSVQAQILNLMKNLQRELDLTYLFISHDLSVVRHMSDIIAVMYLGRIVEEAPTKELFAQPRHPYTRLLLETIPDLDNPKRDREPIIDEVPSPLNPPSGCAFHPRCPLASERCRSEPPEIRQRTDSVRTACHAND